MKFPRIHLLLLLGVALLATACKKDDDKPAAAANETQAPVAARVSPTGTSLNVAAGDTITFSVRVTDNAGLSQVRVNVHNAFDGHTHKTSSVDTLFHNVIHQMNGKTDSTLTFSIPTATTNQPGMYHVLVYALDVNGNNAQFLQYDLELANSLFPTASNLAMTGSDHLHFEPCDNSLTRTLSGTVNAGTGKTLADIHVVLKVHSTGGGHSHKTAHGDEEIELLHIHDVNNSAYTFSASTLTFNRADLEDGYEYDLLVEVEDTEGRKMVFEVGELDAHFEDGVCAVRASQ
jgi:hypothetical protein